MSTKKTTLSLDLAKVMVAGKNKELKAFALENFPELADITEQIKTLEDAVEYLGEKDKTVKRLRHIQLAHASYAHTVVGMLGEENILDTTLSTASLEVIVKALNEKEVLDWNNGKWDKWFPCFYLGDNPRFDDSDRRVSYSDASSRLCLKSEKLSDYLATQFKELLIIHLNNA